ncbi:alcohol dehydrogenase catalytic domain-containing protein [Marispirochaeta aestuarii]|uniref:zinc-dependent alcohol dehydrogenase n=1 Tax=Marispirochaeta aestuarii TaxID=1963862 RepID=UPI0029C8D0BE|nr:alcohol dehydrogenase catalytic domain-containing protein [Marispirochaeta aestuarii]
MYFTVPRDLRYESVPRPVPGRNEVLVRVKSVSICGSDLSGYRGGNPMRVPPLIMGHEFSGEIAECGEGADKFKPKDRVGVITNLYCGTCSNCRQGLQNVCENRFIIGTTMKAGSYNGAMAEYVLAPAEKIVPLPDHVSFNEAAPGGASVDSPAGDKARGEYEGKERRRFRCGTHRVNSP